MSKYPEKGLTGASPADLGWLTGNWLGRNGEDPVEEHWSPLCGNTLMGMMRWVKDDRVFFYELITVEQEGELVLLRIKHFYLKLVGWEEKDSAHEFVLVQLKGQEAVFRELNKPDARWMIYRLESPDRMVSYFVREDQQIGPEGLFVFARQQL